MTELKLVTVHYISIHLYEPSQQGTCVLLLGKAVHEPSDRDLKQLQIKIKHCI